MDIEQLAIKAGVIYVDEKSTYWTSNNALEVLENFARLILDLPDTETLDWRKGSMR